jgi:HYDIN/CFA65/VesB-like, Ig-like domain/Abnormal spindle-like microcephaly-assoc'd, ASPM-SPD-2-Hydin
VHIPQDTWVKNRDSRWRRNRGFRKRIDVAPRLALLVCFCCTSLFAGHKPQLLSASTSGIDFGNLLVGTNSTQAVAITNTGTKNANITGATVTGAGFSYSGPALPLTLSRGQSVNLSVTFAPAVAGTATGSLTLSSNAFISPSSVSLSGNGVLPAIVLSASPSSVNFGNVLVGSTASQTVSLLNSGTGSVNISQATVVGTGFAVSGLALPLTLGPGQSSAFAITFLPVAAGSVSGSISLASDAPNSPTVISLSAAGVQPLISVVPSSVNFGNVTVGLTNTQTVTVSNLGGASLSVTQTAGPGAGFSLSGLLLPLTLAPGQSSSFTLSFAPASSGAFTSSLALVSNAPASPTAISLSGAGVAPILQLSASATSLNFGSVTVGASSTQSVTLTNVGNSNVSVSQISVAGSGVSVSGLALPVTLSAGQTASFNVTFAPTVTGSVTGSVSVISTATNSPLSISLSASAVQASYSVSLSWLASTSSVVGYYVYSGTQASGPFAKLNSTPTAAAAYTDNTVQSGQTYYYLVTAVDSSGVESPASNEASATIP